MTGDLYIDGQDAFANYGLIVVEGGYKNIPAFPPLKTIDFNDWPEDNGSDVDYESLTLNVTEINVDFCFMGSERMEAFFAKISEKSYHDWNFAEAGRTLKLRMLSKPNYKDYVKFRPFSLKFANDFPIPSDYVYQVPVSTITNPTPGTLLGDIDLGQYGCAVLEGTKESIEKKPDVKPNLTQNIQTLDGAIYDDNKVVYKAKDIRLNLLMRAGSLAEFWRNRDSLLYDLTRKEARHLYFNGKDYEFYYKGCTTKDFFPLDKIWYEFQLTLCAVK